MSWPADPVRLLGACGALLAYVLLCVAIVLGQRRKRRSSNQLRGQPNKDGKRDAAQPGWIVAYGSQTGSAEELALQTAQTLQLAGVAVHLCELSEVGLDQLRAAERILFVVSTYGEGDPPDNAAAFAGRTIDSGVPVETQVDASISLPRLHYAVLALGDSTYAAYCGFGKALDGWLQACGAQPLFDRIEVDRGDAEAIDAWRRQLSHMAGTSDAPDWSGPPFSDWRLLERTLLNPGSAGEAVFDLALEAESGPAAQWESGDLVQVSVPSDEKRPREYSIASISAEGTVRLLVRLHRHADGSLGSASGWLGMQLEVGGLVRMRLRQHRRFRLGENVDRPLILVGNGTGIAGLRSHLKTRIERGVHANWLVFGERNAASDFHYRDEIIGWLETGALARLDTAFSRDRPERPDRHYVQHCLLDARDTLRDWVGRGAAIYVCGSLKGMAGGVDDALREVLGEAVLERLASEGRYRRDVY